jgi:hypothetical protein
MDIDYNLDGVRWLDQYLNTQRTYATAEARDKLASVLGSFFGECIRAKYGGAWVHDKEKGWTVKVNKYLTVFPLSKTRKQLFSSEGETVLGLFVGIPTLHKQARVETRAGWPWWKLW